MTQCERLIQYIRKRGGITTAQAFSDLGITRLSGRIFDLRRKGIPITTESKVGKNRHGEKVRFTEYKIQEKEYEQY